MTAFYDPVKARAAPGCRAPKRSAMWRAPGAPSLYRGEKVSSPGAAATPRGEYSGEGEETEAQNVAQRAEGLMQKMAELETRVGLDD